MQTATRHTVHGAAGAGRRALSRATLGALEEPTATGTPSGGAVVLYLGSSVLGSALGGGILGYTAASDFRGAYTGALLAVGAAGVADAILLGKAGIGWGAALGGLIGAAGIGSAVWLSATRKRRRR